MNDNPQAFSTEKAPKAIGPYSQAIYSKGFLFVSGQLPISPETGKIIDSDIKERTTQVLQNISAILASAGGNMANVIKVNLFLTDMNDFQAVNEIYAEHFQSPYPARSAIQVAALPLGANIEAEVIAQIQQTNMTEEH